MNKTWIKRIAIACGVLLLILISLPFLISLDDYIPRIEQAASARLKDPVSIKSIKFAALPVPHITLKQLTIGKADDVAVATVKVTPDLFSLLGATKVIRSIEIEGLILTQKGIDRIPVWSKSDEAKGQQPPAVRVESIRLVNALVKHGKTSFGPFDAHVRLNDQGAPEDASITTQDGKLKVAIKPDKSNYLIDARANSWKLPVGPAIAFDELIIKGVATLNDADFSQVSAKLYGGTVLGKATANWRKGLQVRGNFDVNQVELKSIVPLLAPGTNMSGRLNAKPVFSASASDASQLMDALRLETPFRVENGVLHGVDITQAATNLLKQGAKGGETHFDQLSGQLNMERGAFHFTQVNIASGVLAADGNVNISPKKELSGRINAQVKALGLSSGVPLNVAGTLDSPMLYPTGASMAGAAVGTVMLGPGFGTTVGSKIGAWTSNLFGGKEDKKR
jgi:uncharacterized protein involved in outer membrane biogenesis